MIDEANEELQLKLVDPSKIPCLMCKKGMHNFLAMYCLAYDIKPSEVYYDNAECPNFEPIEK